MVATEFSIMNFLSQMCISADFNEDEFIGIDDLNQYLDAISGGKMTEEVKSTLISHVL